MDFENSEFKFLEDKMDAELQKPRDDSISVSDFIKAASSLLSANFQNIVIVGEVSSFKESQGKWVFFDLKDEKDEKISMSCFMPIWQLHMALEDGMKVKIKGTPSLTKWGTFSFTISPILPVGEGSIKKNFELLKKKLTAEGLFNVDKKRPLPKALKTIGVISSTQAAGYADFIKILNERWGGLKIKVCHTQVQGMSAAGQILRALNYLNEKSEVDVIVIIRGGGSSDDLSAFNDEALVRGISASKIPVLTGIGHEIDTSLSDLAADVVASTPSNAAQMLTPDKHQMITTINNNVARVSEYILNEISNMMMQNLDTDRIKQRIYDAINALASEAQKAILDIGRQVGMEINNAISKLESDKKILESLNPELVLRKGYAIIRGDFDVGKIVEIERSDMIAEAKIEKINKKG